MLPTLADVHSAADVLRGVATVTPLLCCAKLDGVTGGKLRVKAECLQRFGAFKFRGAYHKIAKLAPEVRARGVIAFSSGNHAGAVAAAARMFGIPAVVVMPSDAPRVKIEAVKERGAELVLYDRLRDDREAIGKRLAEERGLALVKPFDDAEIIAGQGTMGLEIAAELTPDLVLVPASGGGLVAGIALALPQSKVYAVEPEGHADIARSLATGTIQKNEPGVRSFCDALMAERMGELPFAIARTHLAGALAISDAAVRNAMRFAFRYLRLVLEPGGAIALAAALEGAVDLKGKSAVIVASGGNVDPELFARVLIGD
ncbi:MAG: threonine/serine dehydratase [Planctomycetes bacterium]|nr:threonine/serine dehydratase [Planctomycetota bacterium]